MAPVVGGALNAAPNEPILFLTKAERRIEECCRNKSMTLDLRNCGLSSLPVSVFEFTHLTELKLSGNRLNNLPDTIVNFQSLKKLEISNNELSSIPGCLGELHNLESLDLCRNNINSISEVIFKLQNLVSLDLCHNRISLLPKSISNLKKLESLNLNSNLFTSLPAVIGELESLLTLDLSDNKLSVLADEIYYLRNLERLSLNRNYLDALSDCISNFEALRLLALNRNRLITIPEAIHSLNSLQILDLGNNQIKRLSKTIFQLPYLSRLELKGNKLEEPPQEIADKGIDAIRQYLDEFLQDTEDYLFEAKLLVVGEGRVGKTSLSLSLQHYDFVLTDEPTTHGIDVRPWILQIDKFGLHKDFRLNVWDFGGQEIYHHTHQFFLTKRSLYLLVTESRRDAQNEDFYYWLNVIRLLGGDSPVVLVLNKCDQPTKSLPFNEYQNAFPNLIQFHQVSCHPEFKNTLSPLRDTIRRIITDPVLVPHVGTLLPRVWVQIRKEIAKFRDEGNDYVSRDNYLAMCARYGMDEARADFLSDYFNDIGVFLYFRDDATLRETVILNHEWVTTGIYRILDSQLVIDKKGRFSENDLIQIWSDEKYRYKRAELRSLMMNRKFELIYELPAGGYLAPQRLPDDVIEYEWRNDKNNLRFEYRYKFMPKGIITRFIVKRHKNIFKETHWRFGVLLYWDDTRALVREHSFEKKITIQLEGVNQRGFLDTIRNTIDEIHSRFSNLNVAEMLPCNCPECSISNEPHFYDFVTLRKFLSKKVATIRCYKSAEEIDIRTLLSEIVISEQSDQYINTHIIIYGDNIDGDKVGGDKIDAEVSDSENVAIGKRSKVRSDT